MPQENLWIRREQRLNCTVMLAATWPQQGPCHTRKTEIPELQGKLWCKGIWTHQMSHSISVMYRMFAVLSRSRKLRDSSFSLVALSTWGATDAASQQPLSFSARIKAEVRGYLHCLRGRWHVELPLDSPELLTSAGFLHPANGHETPTNVKTLEPAWWTDRQTQKCVSCNS